jgi:hypothetical protein
VLAHALPDAFEHEVPQARFLLLIAGDAAGYELADVGACPAGFLPLGWLLKLCSP